MNHSCHIIAVNQAVVKPLTWQDVADFREQLRLLEPAQALEILDILRRYGVRCSGKESK